MNIFENIKIYEDERIIYGGARRNHPYSNATYYVNYVKIVQRKCSNLGISIKH